MQGPLRVALIGAGGRMGLFSAGLLADDPRFELVARLGRGDEPGARARDAGARVALDFSLAGLGEEHGLRLLEAGVRPLIGTSGVDAEATTRLDVAARGCGLGGLVVPNFSVGIWLQQRFALEAARHLPSVEIVEEHHAGKLDAPSGTAIDTAERLRAARPGAAEVPIHALRLAGLYSNQSVVLSGPGEVLRLTHETYGLDAFGPGILAGLLYAARATGVERGIGPALETG